MQHAAQPHSWSARVPRAAVAARNRCSFQAQRSILQQFQKSADAYVLPYGVTSTLPSEFWPALMLIFTRPRAQSTAFPSTVGLEMNLLLHTTNVCSPVGRFLIVNLPSLSLTAKYGSS